jgi:antitoxin ParD1/3/4
VPWQTSLLVRLDQLDELRAGRRNKTLTLTMPVSQALPVSLAEPFYAFVRRPRRNRAAIAGHGPPVSTRVAPRCEHLCFMAYLFIIGATIMADIERVTVALPEPMAASVRAAVEAGEYASTSEVIRDALRLWEARRELRGRDVEELRRRWDAGKASGLAGEINIRDLVADEKTKKARRP